MKNLITRRGGALSNSASSDNDGEADAATPRVRERRRGRARHGARARPRGGDLYRKQTENSELKREQSCGCVAMITWMRVQSFIGTFRHWLVNSS